MPRALDVGQLKVTHSPTERLDLNFGKQLIPAIDLETLAASLVQLIESATGLDLSGLLPLINDISDAVNLLQTALSALTSGDPTQLLAFFTQLADLNLLDAFPNLIGGLLNGGQPVNVLNLFGQIPQEVLGLVSAGWITSDNPNVLNNPGFDGSISMDGEGIWAYDGTDGHTSSGCASTTANGTLKALLGNQISVAGGQKFTVSGWAKSIGYTGTGTPVKLTVRTYFYDSNTKATTPVGIATIAQSAGPGATWTQLSGTYTVPTNGTVNRIRMRLVVDTTATGGTIKFDDAILKLQGNGPFDGLLALFGLANLNDFMNVNVNDIWASIITAFLNPLGLLQDRGARNSLFGGTAVLSQILPNAVGGVTPGTNLATDVGDFLKNMFNGITRTGAASATQADTAVAVAGQADTVVGTAATMEQILAALGSGTPDADDFERTSTTTLSVGGGAQWNVQQTGSGVLATPNGHDASHTGSGNFEFTARKTDKVASTLHQVSTIVLATAIPSYPFFPPYGGNVDLWVLMTAFTTWATRTGLRFRINSTAPYAAAWFIHWVNAGTETQLATGSLSIPAAGASLSWEAGVGGNLLAYQARANGSPVANFTDSVQRGTVGVNMGRGWGGKGAAGFGLPQGVPNIKQWTAQG